MAVGHPTFEVWYCVFILFCFICNKRITCSLFVASCIIAYQIIPLFSADVNSQFIAYAAVAAECEMRLFCCLCWGYLIGRWDSLLVIK